METQTLENMQPSIEAQKELSDIINATTSSVVVRGKAWKCEELYPGAKRKLTEILVNKDEDDMTVSCKAAAVFRLNGYWSIKFFYWIVWRWFYYIKQYREDELMTFFEECKKKVGAEAYYMNTMLLIAMKDTVMNQTREEVERFRVERLTEQLSRLEKNTPN